MEDYPGLGPWIRHIRMESDKSQTYLAAECDVREVTVWRWESGKSVPSALHLGRIADALNTSADHLLGRVPAGQ